MFSHLSIENLVINRLLSIGYSPFNAEFKKSMQQLFEKQNAVYYNVKIKLFIYIHVTIICTVDNTYINQTTTIYLCYIHIIIWDAHWHIYILYNMCKLKPIPVYNDNLPRNLYKKPHYNT